MERVGNSTLGGLLDSLFARVDDTIQQAISESRNAGIEIEIEAGREIELAIENAKNAYKDSLDYTVDKIKREVKDIFDRLNTIVQRFENKVIDEMNDIQVQAQQIANALPLVKSSQPQLSSVKPRYIVIGDIATSALVAFKGNFPRSAQTGFAPTLTFGERQCYLMDSTTQSLTFQVPNNNFLLSDGTHYAFITGKLQVPWDDGWFWSHKTQFEYRVGLGALPQIAGVVTTEYTFQLTQRITQTKSSQEYFYDGNNWYPEHWHTIYQEIYPDPEWLIDVTKPVTPTWTHVHGDHKQGIESVSPDKIVVKIELYCKDGHDIGKVKIRVDFTQWQNQTTEQSRKEKLTMNWKDSQLLQPQTNEVISKVSFDAYDGRHQEFGAPDLDTSVLKIEAQGNGAWKIWAEPPKELVT